MSYFFKLCTRVHSLRRCVPKRDPCCSCWLLQWRLLQMTAKLVAERGWTRGSVPRVHPLLLCRRVVLPGVCIHVVLIRGILVIYSPRRDRAHMATMLDRKLELRQVCGRAQRLRRIVRWSSSPRRICQLIGVVSPERWAGSVPAPSTTTS